MRIPNWRNGPWEAIIFVVFVFFVVTAPPIWKIGRVFVPSSKKHAWDKWWGFA